MKIDPFGVEIWMNETETKCAYNLAETCVASISVNELLEMAGNKDQHVQNILDLKMTYGDIEGSPKLRQEITKLYEKQAEENIIITHGTIGANMLVHKTLVERDDHVVAVVPTYQQHYSIPKSIGAKVDHLQLKEEDGFLPDLDQLKSTVSSNTKLIALNNPNNPTGALIPNEMLKEIVEIAKSADAWILSDEVYRGTAQNGYQQQSIADLYEKGISTASMSKAFSLAGLRLGWVCASHELIEQIAIQRDYDTISVGRIDDYLAGIALTQKDKILNRSLEITTANLKILSEWVEQEPLIHWVKPKAGTTALLKFDLHMNSREFCLDLMDKTGVLFTPGSALNMEGFVRIGFANQTEVLIEGLRHVTEYLRQFTNDIG